MEDWKIEKRLKQLSKNGFLTKQSIELLFEEFKNDKINNVPSEESEARTILILGNIKLVYFVLTEKLGLKYVDESMDEFTIGKMGLIKAIDTFNKDYGAKFSTYAIPVIKSSIFMYYRTLNDKSHQIEREKLSLEDVIHTDENGDDLTYNEVLGEDDEYICQIPDKDLMGRLLDNLKCLSSNEQLMIIHYFGLFGKMQLNQGQIGEMLHTSRSNVTRKIQKALKKLKVMTINEQDLTTEERFIKYQIIQQAKKVDKNL